MPAIRPETFDEFTGNRDAVNVLQVAVRSALARKAPLPHILLSGPFGVGKTTLACSVLPTEMSCEVRQVNCAAIEKPEDALPLFTTVRAGSILFLDEAHMLPGAVREHLLSILEDSYVSVKVGEELVRVDLPKFSVICATTRVGRFDGPFRSRFQYEVTLTEYTTTELVYILEWHAHKHGYQLTNDGGLGLLADAAQGSARTATNLLATAADLMLSVGSPGLINLDLAERTLSLLGYRGGLTALQSRYIHCLSHGTKSIRTLADSLSESQTTIETVVEPYLIRRGLIDISSAGRSLSESGRKFNQRFFQ